MTRDNAGWPRWFRARPGSLKSRHRPDWSCRSDARQRSEGRGSFSSAAAPDPPPPATSRAWQTATRPEFAARTDGPTRPRSGCRFPPVGSSRCLSRNQEPAEQRRRLHRHADALGDDRMRLAGAIADAEYAVGIAVANSGPDRAGGEPCLVERGPLQRVAHARARRLNVVQRGLRRPPVARRAPALLERVAPDATRQADAPAIGVNHAAIAAGKRQQRHQIGRQIAIRKVRLEAQQIGGPVRSGRLRRQ